MAEAKPDIHAIYRDMNLMKDEFEKSLQTLGTMMTNMENKEEEIARQKSRASPVTVVASNNDEPITDTELDEMQKNIQEFARDTMRRLLTIKALQKAYAEHDCSIQPQGGKKIKKRKGTKKSKGKLRTKTRKNCY